MKKETIFIIAALAIVVAAYLIVRTPEQDAAVSTATPPSAQTTPQNAPAAPQTTGSEAQAPAPAEAPKQP